ncbi:MAG: DUF4169 family protein [Allorhizobium sp.]
MTADVVNLRQFKKAKARTERERDAEQNRVSFGRTKAEKNLTRALRDKAQKTLDQGRIEKPASEE